MIDIKLLLVDDEAVVFAPMIKEMTRQGLTVRTADCGTDVLAILQEFPADVIVLDMKTSGEDDLMILNKIKQQHPLVEVIMLTEEASMVTALRGLELGAFDYRMKPVDFDDLFFKVEDAARRKKRQEKRLSEEAAAE